MDKGFSKWLYLAWVIALIGTLGSLFSSEVLNFIPCKLCWFQRVFMYPLSIILGIACFRNDTKIGLYTLPLSIIGGLIALFQVFEQKFHIQSHFCQSDVPCSGHYINWLGFITIPMLSFVAFLVITISLAMSLKKR